MVYTLLNTPGLDLVRNAGGHKGSGDLHNRPSHDVSASQDIEAIRLRGSLPLVCH